MLSKYSSDNETQGSKDSENIIPYNVLCINSFGQADSTSLSGHHSRVGEKNINWFKKWKNRKKKGEAKEVKYTDFFCLFVCFFNLWPSFYPPWGPQISSVDPAPTLHSLNLHLTLPLPFLVKLELLIQMNPL